MNPQKSTNPLPHNTTAKNRLPDDSSPSLVLKERLRQARLSFNVALIMMAATAVTSLIGVGLLMAGKISAGTLTTVGGFTSTACFLKIAKDANDRLDKLASKSDES